MPIERAASVSGLHSRPISVVESYKRHRAECARGCFICGAHASISRTISGRRMAFCKSHADYVNGDESPRSTNANDRDWQLQRIRIMKAKLGIMM